MPQIKELAKNPTNAKITVALLKLLRVKVGSDEPDDIYLKRILREKIALSKAPIASFWKKHGQLPELGLTQTTMRDLRIVMIQLMPNVQTNVALTMGSSKKGRRKPKSASIMPTVKRGNR
jgi:hypothetical protein